MRSLIVLLALVIPAAGSSPAEPPVDVLSAHQTDAVYEGTRHLPCRHRTSLCPDKCGHAKDVAVFRITAYRSYTRANPSYGDPQAAEFLMPLNVGEEVSAGQVEIVRGLKAGESVKLDWQHEYVRADGASYPRRRVTRLDR